MKMRCTACLLTVFVICLAPFTSQARLAEDSKEVNKTGIHQNQPMLATTVWEEDFEGGLGDWYADAGTWQVGTPTSGPDSAYQVKNAAGTVLGGNYGSNVTSRLISPSFTVPSAGNYPRLRYWHWYWFASGDSGRVQIKPSGGEWETISPIYALNGSDAWTRPSIDLSAYAGQTVQIAFLFTSNRSYNSYGWFIDLVTVETGNPVFNAFEDWESGLDDWYVDKGTWEIGKPSSGPGAAYNGSNAAATQLSGNYRDYVDSRLVSPQFNVPSAGENPRLRFWHWYNFASGDTGYVQVRTPGGEWQTISPAYKYNSSNAWTKTFLDLSSFAGQDVELAFYLHSNGRYYTTGWYIDDIELETGPLAFNEIEDWESGLDDWYVDQGTWEVGVPTSGPDSAYQVQNAAGTVLSGNYDNNVTSRLISPSFTVPSVGQQPRLRYWHWYWFANGDSGRVQIKPNGGEWETISPTYALNSSDSWTRPLLDLSAYAGQTVQLAFLFKSNGSYSSYGWFIDQVELETGPLVFNSFEDWESGLDDWYVDMGTWEVGEPTSGPGVAYNGSNAAGTMLSGNYRDEVSSRLISPQFTVPSSALNPRIRFWHWYNFASGDSGVVQIRPEGGVWQSISIAYQNSSSNAWTRPLLDLSEFADQTVQIAFLMSSDGRYYTTGWYIDDIELESDQEPPTTANANVMGPQDVPLVIHTTDIPYDDPGLATLAHIQVTSLPASGNLAVDANDNLTLDSGEELAQNDIVTKSDLDSDRLVWFVPAGEHGYRIDSFNFNVNNGTLSSTDATMHLTLNATKADLPGIAGQGGWQLLGNSWDSTPADLLDDIWTQGASAGADASSGSPNVFTYDEATTSYQPVTDLTQPLADGQGLAVYVYADENFDGADESWPKTVSTSGNSLGAPVGITVSNNDNDGMAGLSGDEGWNLIGNPFGTGLEVDSVITALEDMGANPNNSVYIWDKTLQSGNGDWVVLTEGNQENAAAFQAMFVRVLNSGMGAATLMLHNRYRSLNNGQILKETVPEEPLGLELFVSSQEHGLEQKAAFRFSELASPGFDEDDVYSLWPMSDHYMRFASHVGDQLLKINHLPLALNGEQEIPIVFETSASGRMQLSWKQNMLPASFNFVLKDNKSGLIMDLRERGSYSFEYNSDKGQKAKEAPEDLVNQPMQVSSKAEEAMARFTLFIRSSGINESEEILAEKPVDFLLNQNYPNPFNPTTKIEFGLPEASDVSLKVYDITGKEVATLVEQHKAAGIYSLNWDASQLASGLYIYRLITNKKVITKKMMLIK